MSERVNVFRDAIQNNLGPIMKYLNDPTVSEIMINGHEQIFIERKGKIEKTDAQFSSEDALRAAVNSIAQSVGRRVNEEEPRLDARLPEGYRIGVVIPPCAKGTTVAIRKFSSTKISFSDYIKMGTLTEDTARFLDICMFLGKNIIVSGGTGSGKTTLLSVLASRIPKGQRLIIIEDTAELQIDYDHAVFFETRQADAFGKGEVTIKDLVKSALRLRPDRIIVGEVRSSEALDLLSAMNTGHKGCLGTVHANTPEDAIVRLEALAQGGDAKISERALRQQVSSGVDMIVQISRYNDGSRRIGAISEVRGFNADGTYDVVPIFQMSRLVRKPDGRLEGRLEPSGEVPSFYDEIVDNRLPFPKSKFSSQAE